MDLGISGRKALVCAASKGLGKACALSLAKEGVDVTIVARGEEALSSTAAQIRSETKAQVTVVAADITTDAGRAAALSACPTPDILINNAGGPPPGDFRDWDRDDWIAALDANMLTAIFLIKSVLDGMVDRGFGRIVNITSSAVKAPIDILGLSNGARGGLTGFIGGLARQRNLVRNNVTINNMLPGSFDTERVAMLLDEATRKKKIEQSLAGRFGDPEEFGHLCAYLCSAKSGYITGQNILIDGGSFLGTM
jgi:3-oxoacyl-[acyl-carrier protein] reductase